MYMYMYMWVGCLITKFIFIRAHYTIVHHGTVYIYIYVDVINNMQLHKFMYAQSYFWGVDIPGLSVIMGGATIEAPPPL